MATLGGSRVGNRWPVIAGLAVVAVIALLQLIQLPGLDRIGLLLFDSYQRAAPRTYEDAAIKVVDIDDESIRRRGQWPWPRTEIARLLDRLGDAGASVVAFDVVFSEPDRTSPARIADSLARSNPAAAAQLRRLPDNDAALAQSVAATPTVLGYFLVNDAKGPQIEPKAGFAIGGSPPSQVPDFRRGIESLPVLMASAAGSGSVSLAADGDGILRSVPLVARQGDQLLPSLSLEALRVAQGAGSIQLRTSDASGEIGGTPGRVVAIKVGQFEIPTTDSGALWLHHTPRAPERIVPAWKVLDEATPAAELEGAFAGRIVFVGAGAIGLRDLRSTPLYDAELGVLMHAQAAEQAILGKYLLRPDWGRGLELGLVLLLGIALALLLPRLGAASGAAIVLAAVALMIAGSWLAFVQANYLLDPTWPVLTLMLVYSLQTVLVYYREERRRAYIHSAFDRYLSPEMVRRIADNPGSLELGGEEREMTVLFCDVRGFSRISESMAPKTLIQFLIALLTPLCDVLMARKATIDKFIGDAIVAFWNAPLDDPDHHRNAARAALEMMAKLDELNAEGKSGWPGEVKIGVGLNCGICCVGNMGSEQRLSYTLIGDTVNLASRIEGLTKFYGVPIAIGSALRDRLDGFAMVELDLVRVVGRDHTERLFALLGDEAVAARPEFVALAEQHSALLTAYREQDWLGAQAIIGGASEATNAYGLGTLYGLYRDRIAELAQSDLPVDWNGVFEARSK